MYGSAARGGARPDSDIDVFLITREAQSTRTVRRQLSEAEFLIGRPLDVVEYTAATMWQRASTGNPFVNRVLAAPKTWIHGGPEGLAGMKTA